MKKKFIFIILIFLVLLSLVGVLIFILKEDQTLVISNIEEFPLTYENMGNFLSNTDLVSDIPENSVVLLRFYNFNTGEREFEKSYILKKGFIQEGFDENAEVTIFVDSKYMSELTSKNFCDIMTLANNNGDLDFDSSISFASLLWKYKGLNKYKGCFGL